jgi:hypothetical protein
VVYRIREEVMGHTRVLWQGRDFSDTRFRIFNPFYDILEFEDIGIKRVWEFSIDEGKNWQECDTPTEVVQIFVKIYSKL